MLFFMLEAGTSTGNVVTVKGPKGTLTKSLHPAMIIEKEGAEIVVKRPSDAKEHPGRAGPGAARPRRRRRAGRAC